MSSSSSSSEDDSAPARKKGKEKGKKSKKDKKKAKKSEKKAKKAEKKAVRAEAWDCDRPEAVRLIKQLLQLDPGTADELRAVFEMIDAGDTVRIDGLESKHVKKKLRHLMQALKLAPVDGQGFKTASKKVSFLSLFTNCLKAAKKGAAGAAPVPVPEPSPAAAAVEPEPAAAEASPGADAPAEMAVDGEPAAAAAPARPRVVGPQLPMPGVGPAVGGSSSDEEEAEDGAGPRVEGAERQGVDLDDIPMQSRREAWMTTPHESIAAAFGEGGGRKADKYEVKRTKEEQEAFEKMFKDRGPSLLQEKMEQKFADHEEEMDKVRQRKVGAPDIWGVSAKEQERNAGAPAAPSRGLALKRPFDPETDLRVTKPITGADFASLVDSSISGLAGRFSRGQVATSFL